MLKIALRRFVSRLQGRNKIIFFVVLVLICVMAMSIGIYVQFFYKYADTDPFMIGINIGAQKTAEEYAYLESNFEQIFQNNIKMNSEEIRVDKSEKDKDLIYTAYDVEEEDEQKHYSVNAKIPVFNINSKEAQKINEEIKKEYYIKATDVTRQTEGNTVYNVSYAAFSNEDIVSIVIRASLKENDKSEKLTIKTYTYSMQAEKQVPFSDLIELKKTTPETVQKTIDGEIQTAYENAQIIASEYGAMYERDLNDKRYKVENASEFFLTDDGYVYLIFAYGNEKDTNEMDIVIF